jgi:hypothetical protein
MLEAEVVFPTNLQVNRQSELAPLSELTASRAHFGIFMCFVSLVCVRDATRLGVIDRCECRPAARGGEQSSVISDNSDR